MRAIILGLQQLTCALRRTLRDRDTIAPRSRSTARLPRTRLAVEMLEARDLLTTLLPPIGTPAPPLLPPPAPAFSLTAVSATAVNVSWGSVANVNDYTVQELNVNSAWQTLATVSGTNSYAVTGLSPNSTYEFRVGSDDISFASPQTITTPVSAPTFAVQPLGNSQILVTWSSVPGATGYHINLALANGYQEATAYVNASITSYEFGLLNPGVSYQVQVGAVDSAGTVWASVQTCFLSAAPTFGMYALSPVQLEFSWTAVPGATGYEIVTPGAQGSVFANVGNVTGYTWAGAFPGATYTFEVVSLGPWNAAVSSPQSITMPTTLPPFQVTAESASQVTLWWSPLPGATGYEVGYQPGVVTGNAPPPAPVGLANNVTTDTINNLSAATEYSFKVGATGPWGTLWANAQPVLTYPAAPSSFTATAASANTINLSWSQETSATAGYILLMSSPSTNGWQTLAYPGSSATSFSSSAFSPDTTYQFELAAGNASGFSYTSPVSALTYPSAPVFTLTPTTPTFVSASWNSVAGATSYVVQQDTPTGWQVVDTVGGYMTGALIVNLSEGNTYQFRVGAVDASGTTWAVEQSVTTPTVVPGSGWSGYVAPGGPFTSVYGSWVQPVVSSTATSTAGASKVAIWVGFDGNSNGTVEQLGTAWTESMGYYAWIEFFGNGTQTNQGNYYNETRIEPLTIQPGDTISAGLTYLSSTQTTSTFSAYFNVVSPNGASQLWSKNNLVTDKVVPARSSAEWIVESPAFTPQNSNSIEFPLANFGTVNFTGAWASNGSTTGPITDFTNYYAEDLQTTGNSDGGVAYVGTLTNANTAGPLEGSGDASSSFSDSFVAAVTSVPFTTPVLSDPGTNAPDNPSRVRPGSGVPTTPTYLDFSQLYRPGETRPAETKLLFTGTTPLVAGVPLDQQFWLDLFDAPESDGFLQRHPG